jgi:hypothetical protein
MGQQAMHYNGCPPVKLTSLETRHKQQNQTQTNKSGKTNKRISNEVTRRVFAMPRGKNTPRMGLACAGCFCVSASFY